MLLNNMQQINLPCELRGGAYGHRPRYPVGKQIGIGEQNICEDRHTDLHIGGLVGLDFPGGDEGLPHRRPAVRDEGGAIPELETGGLVRVLDRHFRDHGYVQVELQRGLIYAVAQAFQRHGLDVHLGVLRFEHRQRQNQDDNRDHDEAHDAAGTAALSASLSSFLEAQVIVAVQRGLGSQRPGGQLLLFFVAYLALHLFWLNRELQLVTASIGFCHGWELTGAEGFLTLPGCQAPMFFKTVETETKG